MKKVLILMISFVVVVSILKVSAATTAVGKENLNEVFTKQQELDIGVSLKTSDLLKKSEKSQNKFSKLKNIYELNKKTANSLTDIEVKLIPFKGGAKITALQALSKFLRKYVTTEFPYKVELKEVSNVEIAYTNFSLFNDGEYRSGENYAVVKKGDRYIVIIQGYYREINEDNKYQKDLLDSILQNFNFNEAYNENLSNDTN